MRIYKKFSTADLNVLEESFKRHSFYPSKIKIKKLAKSLTTNFSKIENWFKYKRRKMYFCGKFSDYKIRKIFTMEENNYLDTIFLQNRKPNYQKCKEISTHLPDISSYQIKNWFSNRRRKMRNEKKRLGGLKRETKSKRKHQLCNEKKEKNPTFKQKIAVKQSDATVIEVKTIEPPKLESNVLLKVEENIKKCESQDECQFKKEIAYNMQFSHKNSLFKESNYPNYLKSNMVQNQFFSNNQVMNFIKYLIFKKINLLKFNKVTKIFQIAIVLIVSLFNQIFKISNFYLELI